MFTTYNIFISHSWNYTDAYERLRNLLNARSYFSWQDFSVRKDDPIHSVGLQQSGTVSVIERSGCYELLPESLVR